MSDKENIDPRTTSKYEKRQRKQTVKGEKLTQELKKKKHGSQNRKMSKCKTCESGIADLNCCQRCCVCSQPIHVMCTIMLNGDGIYCSKCVGQLKWEEIEEFEASNSIKHLILNVPTKTGVRWCSPGQIEQKRLAAVARRKERMIENQAIKEIARSHQNGTTPIAKKISPEKQLLKATEILEDTINTQLRQLELQLSQTKTITNQEREEPSFREEKKDEEVAIEVTAQEKSEGNSENFNEIMTPRVNSNSEKCIEMSNPSVSNEQAGNIDHEVVESCIEGLLKYPALKKVK